MRPSRLRSDISPAAVDLVNEWAWLHERLRACYAAGLLVIGGCLSGAALLAFYLKQRHVHYADAFHTSLLYNNSFTSACIAALGLVNAGWLNGISQTKLGY